MRIVSWNCRNASKTSRLWDYLLELDPDLAILQDFRTIPEHVLQVYRHARNPLSPRSTALRATFPASWSRAR